MRHSFSTSNFYLKENPKKILDWALDNKFAGIEIWADVPHFYVDNVKEDLLKSYRKESGNLTFSVHTPIYGVGIGSVNPGILRESFRQLENIIKWADVMPFEIFVLHAGTTPSDIPQVRNIVRDIIYRSMEDIKKVAQKKEVEIVIENTGISDRYWDRDVKNLITLMDDFELGLCLDIGHINLCRDPEGEYRALEKYIKHIHISDNNKTNDDHFPVGEGAIDYNIYNDMLRKFNGLTVHEIHAPADPAEAILRSRDNLNKILVKNVSRETFKRTKDDV